MSSNKTSHHSLFSIPTLFPLPSFISRPLATIDKVWKRERAQTGTSTSTSGTPHKDANVGASTNAKHSTSNGTYTVDAISYNERQQNRADINSSSKQHTAHASLTMKPSPQLAFNSAAISKLMNNNKS